MRRHGSDRLLLMQLTPLASLRGLWLLRMPMQALVGLLLLLLLQRRGKMLQRLTHPLLPARPQSHHRCRLHQAALIARVVKRLSESACWFCLSAFGIAQLLN
jgi:hypothetical protein